MNKPQDVILGIGPGRCGTLSLTTVLAAQPGFEAAHERFRPIPFDFNKALAREILKSPPCLENWRKKRGIEGVPGTRAEIGYFWTYRAADFLRNEKTARAVVLLRDEDQVRESWLRIAKTSNPWSLRIGPGEDRARYDSAFPKFDLPREEACAAYVADNYARCFELRATFPDRVFFFRTEWFNDADALLELLEFCGVERPNCAVAGTHRNRWTASAGET